MSKASSRPVITMPTLKEDQAINAGALTDPDAPVLTQAQLAEMVPLRTLRGRPKSVSPKTLISVRYSKEVINYFRGLGAGWQSRMDDVLLGHVVSHQGKPDESRQHHGKLKENAAMATKGSFFIEKRQQGDFAIRKANSQRASATAPTQAAAIARAKQLDPDAALHVERVRHTEGGKPDKWRKL